jgi:predicted RNA-binding protein with PUA-like domain
MSINYWLMKSEPNVYSITDLEKETTTIWDGVRNYQARNFLRQMQPGDIAFFYHSNTKIPGIVGLMEIIRNLDDPSQFDVKSSYYDPQSKRESPRWQTVEVKYLTNFPQMISLNQLKEAFSGEDLWVVKRGNRLSVIPVSEKIAKIILTMANFPFRGECQ